MVEIASPLAFADITCLCRISKNGLAATCCICGAAITSGVHLCEIAWGGFWCSRCCPACNGQIELTGAERAAMERNRLLSIHAVLLRKRNGKPAPMRPPRALCPSRRPVPGHTTSLPGVQNPKRNFRPDGQRGVIWSLIPAEGIEYVHLCRLSPFSEEATWLTLRRLDRVFKAVSVERVG